MPNCHDTPKVEADSAAKIPLSIESDSLLLER